jgi:hypothetical protein
MSASWEAVASGGRSPFVECPRDRLGAVQVHPRRVRQRMPHGVDVQVAAGSCCEFSPVLPVPVIPKGLQDA